MASVVGAALLGEVCEMVLEMTVRRLVEEANMVVNFREDFRWLSDQLIYLRGFLKDAAQKSQQREHVKHWLEKIRVISFLAEDIWEECIVEYKYGNSAQSCGLNYKQWIFQYRMGRRIKDIKGHVSSIVEDSRKLELLHRISSANEAGPSTSQSAEWKRSSLLPRDPHTVGIDSKVDDMLRLLGNPSLPIIAVVGMGGMGKTHLLQHVYNSINERYEKSIWLSVSQSYSISTLQKNLVFQVDKDLSKQIQNSEIGEEVLAPEIHRRLQGKRCLVVLDDVWRAGGEDDLLGRLGLPGGENNPCKIMVSTRSREVCRNWNAEIYEMQYLSDEDSWRLFCAYAFEEGRQAPQHLEEVGRMIVKQCGNLPLAIKTIGASLAKSRMPMGWKSKLQQLERAVAADVDDRIMPILRLSYDALPALLKACFAYLSFFPEDEEIDPEYLVNLWIGEGFISAREGQWDAAWHCLYQLANLCLVQLWEDRSPTKYCRLHDLLLDLAIQVSRENKCVFSVEEAFKDDSAGWCRILLRKKEIKDDDISKNRLVCLRTFSLSQNRGITSISTNLFTAMRGLRVLDLSKTEISTLPESIGKIKLLKVLNLNDTKIEEVPVCVRHLKSLLFLAVSWRCERLPAWMGEVKCLEHLECFGVSRMPRGISELVSLRILRSARLDMSVGDGEFMRWEDFGTMTQLQELRLNVLHEMDLKGMEEWILARLVKMRDLEIRHSGIGTEILELQEKIRAMKDLESLLLERFSVPGCICDLMNLRNLILIECNCSEYPELQRMPNLARLVLSLNDRCRQLPNKFGKAGAFPQLRFLEIHHFSELEEFPELEEGTMECLEEFRLGYCPEVKKVGEGFEQLKRLKLFSYRDSGTSEVREKFQEGGEYWHKVKYINPNITIDCR